MRRLLPYWPAALLLLAASLFVGWRLVGPRIVGGPVRPPIMSLPPRLGDIPAGAADSAFAGAPLPRFTSLTRVRRSSRGEDTITYSVVAARGWRSVLHLGQEHDFGTLPSGSDQWFGGAWDLYDGVFARRARNDGRPEPLTLRRRIHVTAVRGRLFPLAVGNRLAFRTSWEVQVNRRVKRTLKQEVELRVTGVTGTFADSTPAIPGPVFVIERRTRRGGTPEVVHYAPELGTAVSSDGPFRGERLIAWH
jgi:hypothetical protein